MDLDSDTTVIDVVAADDDVVGVDGLGDPGGGGAGGTEVDGEAEVVERELAVVAGDGEEAGGVEALVEGVGEEVADPLEVGLAGAVVEREDEDEAAVGFFFGGAGVGGLGVEDGGEEEEGQEGEAGGERDGL